MERRITFQPSGMHTLKYTENAPHARGYCVCAVEICSDWMSVMSRTAYKVNRSCWTCLSADKTAKAAKDIYVPARLRHAPAVTSRNTTVTSRDTTDAPEHGHLCAVDRSSFDLVSASRSHCHRRRQIATAIATTPLIFLSYLSLRYLHFLA